MPKFCKSGTGKAHPASATGISILATAAPGWPAINWLKSHFTVTVEATSLGTASIYNTGEIGYVPVIPEPEAIISAIILLIGGIVAYFKNRPRRLHLATSPDLSTPLQQD
jgi:hypothetical protein